MTKRIPFQRHFHGASSSFATCLTKVQLDFCRQKYDEASGALAFSDTLKKYSPVVRLLMKYWPLIQCYNKPTLHPTALSLPKRLGSDSALCDCIDHIVADNQSDYMDVLLAWFVPIRERLRMHASKSKSKADAVSVGLPQEMAFGGAVGTCIHVHLNPEALHSALGLPAAWFASAEALSELIIQRWRIVTHVAVTSWIVDRLEARFQKLGFRIVNEDQQDYTSNAAWGQLLKVDGSMHPTRLSAFERVRFLPWKSKTALLSVEPLLRKYAPSRTRQCRVQLHSCLSNLDAFRVFWKKLYLQWDLLRHTDGAIRRFAQIVFQQNEPDFLKDPAFEHLERMLCRRVEMNVAELDDDLFGHEDTELLWAMSARYMEQNAVLRAAIEL